MTGENHTTVEGGFLTGRNPFVFMAAAPLPTFIIQMLVIVIASRVVKLILTPLKQPSVIAEIISGILLGPTVMGRIPYFTETIFPKPSLPFLHLMSNFGLVLFLFLVGLELDPRVLKKSIKKSFAISLAGMALPFLMGCGSSYILFEYVESEASRQKGFVSYLLFLGVAISITAFPVLARILSELDLLKTKVGGITMSAAAVDDTTSWCLLALVISIINANSNLTAVYVFLMGLGYSLFLLFIVRPIFVGGLRMAGTFEKDQPSQASIFFALMLLFISAFITDAIGIHAIFGGFITGVIMPHERGFAYHITDKLEDIVAILFLPLYFALSGLKTKIGTLDDPIAIAVLFLVIFVACFGKIFGCTMAARLTKLNWRESFAVGALMNCKGLVELIVLNLGYDAGVISDKTFALMVIMALVTTFITVPIVSRVYPKEYQEAPESEDYKRSKDPSLLVSVNRIEQVGPLLTVINLVQNRLNKQKLLRDDSSRKSSKSSISSIPGDQMSFKSKTSSGSIHGLLHGNPITSIFPGGKLSAVVKGRRGKYGVTINALRLIELTERDSSVMLSASHSALSNDPITKLLTTFCEMTNSANHVEGIVKVVTLEMFGRVLAQVGEQVNAQYILVPWTGAGAIVEDPPPNRYSVAGLTTAAKRRYSIHTLSQHAVFFQDLMQEVKTNLLIFVDRGAPMVINGQIPDVSGKSEIYLPFFGGKDDREALELVMGLSESPNLHINVIRFKNSGGNGRNGGALSGAGDQQQQVAIQLDDLDEKVLQYYFRGRSNSTTGGGGGAVAEMEKSSHNNVHYSEVENPSPVARALEYMGNLGGTDLVIMGQNSLKIGDGRDSARLDDGERRRIIGDFAESIMECNCNVSLLVVRSSK